MLIRRRAFQSGLPIAAVAALTTGACVPAPGPMTPPQGTLEVGADYRPRALNRWVCESSGSLVLASTPSGFLLHLENYDWVLQGEDAGASVRFGQAPQTVYLASKTKGGQLLISHASGQEISVDEKCSSAEESASW